MSINSNSEFRLSQEQLDRMKKLMETRPGRTPIEMINQIFDLGLYHLEYRTAKNREKAAEMKMFREWKKQQA